MQVKEALILFLPGCGGSDDKVMTGHSVFAEFRVEIQII